MVRVSSSRRPGGRFIDVAQGDAGKSDCLDRDDRRRCSVPRRVQRARGRAFPGSQARGGRRGGQAGARRRKEELATFGNGCFWCTEAVFQRLKGVSKVVSGYSGGNDANPTYKQVCTGTTGHAEVIQVTFDPAVISYPELLEVFWRSHDPTTLNRQGNDVGTQYRSVIFTHSDRQKQLAESTRRRSTRRRSSPGRSSPRSPRSRRSIRQRTTTRTTTTRTAGNRIAGS